MLADSNALEYTVGSGVPANPVLKPLAELDRPVVDPAELNGPQVITMMQDAGTALRPWSPSPPTLRRRAAHRPVAAQARRPPAALVAGARTAVASC